MNEKQAKVLALRFLDAVTTADVDKVIKSEPAFAATDNWRTYGGRNKNWELVSGQTSDPVGALAELIINSIDAILMRKAHEAGLDASSDGAPKSMTEAVKRFFPEIIEGKIAHLSPTERTALAEKSVVVGVKRGKGSRSFPTYTIADSGEGQNAADFPKTLVSLGETNKERIPFVQGKFNMGSTGCLMFCTQSDLLKGHYKFILSKRTLSDSDGKWGWTLVRTREVRSEEELPVVEYFCPDGQIPAFATVDIHALGRSDIGVVDGGTVVKLYEYYIGDGAHSVDFGLYYALTTNLLHCALPIRIYDFDARVQPKRAGLRKEGVAERTFSGLHISVERETDDDADSDTESKGGNIDLPRYLVDGRADVKLGTINIYATGIKELKDHMRRYPYRVFYTLNGQAQSKEYKGFFNQAKLDELQNHLLVEVDCDAMDRTLRSSVFKSDRERMSGGVHTRKLRDIVADALKGDGALREYATKIRERRAGEQIQETEADATFWNDLIRQAPELRELLGMGGPVFKEDTRPRGDDEFVGEKFPTFLKLTKPADGILQLPVNTYRRIEFDTDAENQYFGRPADTGRFVSNLDDRNDASYSRKLRNGKLRITVFPPENAQVGKRIDAEFGIHDSSRPEPLTVPVEIVFAPPEKPQPGGNGERTGVRKNRVDDLKFPAIVEVTREKWTEHGFGENSGAYCSESDAGATIYVNRDNEQLRRFLVSEREPGRRELTIHRFKYGVGILTFAMHKKFKDEYGVNEGGDSINWTESVRLASSAIAAHVVTLITRLGENRK
ncbi:MAG: hypothetical protein OXU98_08075 [Gammaproteobacteria bacterium]|nr:hypothetical protein [Gammaproteobacteria bacterium]